MNELVLLGAGYANMSFLKSFTDYSSLRVTLITREPYHYATVLLHEIASGFRDSGVVYRLDSVIDSRVNLVIDEVLSVNKDSVTTKNGVYHFDFLIIGLGFVSNDFGVKGASKYANSISSYRDAISIRDKVSSNIALYKTTGNATYLNFVVCGGGLTGIELVSSLAEQLRKRCLEDGIDPSVASVVCIESGKSILPTFGELLAAYTLHELEKLGVTVKTGHRVLECREDSVVISSNGTVSTLAAGLIIWTAGVKGACVSSEFLPLNGARCRVVVNRFLQIEEFDNIFALGDASAATIGESVDTFCPMTAAAAVSQGKYLARELINIISHSSSSRGYFFREKGALCSIGSKSAVGIIMGVKLKGALALLAKRLVEFMWHFKLLGFFGSFKGS